MLWLLWMDAARAHGGAVPIRGVYDWSQLPDAEPGAWIVWEFYPSIVLGCLFMAALYEALAGPLRRRWALSEHGPSVMQRVCFYLGLGTVFWALQGPLHELSEVYLFAGHMVQHLAITLVFPPLWLVGTPGWMWRPLLQIDWVRAVGRFLTNPFVAALLASGTLYLWHIPVMYEWALADHDVHIAEHLSFMITATIMWWPSLSRSELLPPLTPGKRMVYLFLLTIPMKGLGAVITVADDVLYPFYASQPRVFGLDPLTDQRLGGLIMWLPGGLVFWVSIAYIFFRHYYVDFVANRQGPKRANRSSVSQPSRELA